MNKRERTKAVNAVKQQFLDDLAKWADREPHYSPAVLPLIAQQAYRLQKAQLERKYPDIEWRVNVDTNLDKDDPAIVVINITVSQVEYVTTLNLRGPNVQDHDRKPVPSRKNNGSKRGRKPKGAG